jgi:membrane-associated phospholipid phosphatase
MENENNTEELLLDGSVNEAPQESEAEEAEKEQYVPKNRFEKALYSVYKNDTLNPILHVLSYAIVALTAYAFIWRTVNLIVSDIWQAVWLLLVTGVPFVLVSIARRLINAPRPYELLEFYQQKPKAKCAQSFPSRHVFSVTVIGVCLIPWSLFVGIGILLLGVALASIRVLLGIHFIRDVVAGAAIGVLSGVIGLLLNHIL